LLGRGGKVRLSWKGPLASQNAKVKRARRTLNWRRHIVLRGNPGDSESDNKRGQGTGRSLQRKDARHVLGDHPRERGKRRGGSLWKTKSIFRALVEGHAGLIGSRKLEL